MNHIKSTLGPTREVSSAAPSSRTIEDVIADIEKMQALTPRTKSDFKSALRTISKAIGKPANAIPAYPPTISNRLKDFEPAELDLRPASWSNALSLGRKAMRLAGCYVAPCAYYAPLSPAWSILAAMLGTHYSRSGLSRFMHIMSDGGCDPRDVTDAHFERYRHELETQLACKNVPKEDLRVRQLWNHAVRTVPGWPSALVRTAQGPEGYCYKWPSFPVPLKAELDVYLAKRSTADIFKENAAKPLRPATLKDQEFKVRQFASALVRSGVRIELLSGLRELLDPERLQIGFRFFLARSQGQVTSQIIGIAEVLVGVARWGGGLTDVERDLVINILNKVRLDGRGRSRGRRAGLTEKNKALLRQFDDPVNVAKIVFAADILCDGFPPNGPLTSRQAQAVRSALTIELLLVFPIREENLASMHLDKHLSWSQAGRRGVVSIYIQQGEVKNDQDLEVQLPDRTARLLEYYLKHALPVLGDPTTPWLFPGRKGHLHPRGMGEQFKRVMKRALGLRLNLHFTRHLCAKLYLDRNAGQFRVVQLALGHKSMETTMRFYAEFSSVAALKLVDENLLGLRSDLAEFAPSRKGRGEKK